MRSDPLLTLTSLLSIFLMTLHVTDDIVRGISPPGADNVFGVVIFVVWLLGTLVLAGRASGYIIMLLGGVFAAAMPVLHMTGSGYVGIAESRGGFFFVWTLFAVGTAGAMLVILSSRAIWRLRMRARGAPAPSSAVP